ncbi:MAG: MBL fold metallo-hydrolase [Gammaproteobacteria bacterium]|nr:MBL fold metallo-hydrolase [Gammaproteobacteria bacterium]
MSEDFLRFWGVRGSYPAPFDSHCKVGGNTSCVEIRVGEHVVICDAGSGIIPLGNELMKQQDIREITIILTHYHWDHISGLPFFVPAFVPGWKIHFFGPGETEQDIAKHISDQMKAPYFPVETETWLADVKYIEAGSNPLNIGPIKIEHFNVHHPGSTYGYRIEAGNKTIVYASDNELSFINQSIERRKAEFDVHEQTLLEEMKEEEKRRALEFMQGVDILIHDAQYTPEDYQKKRGWGHSCYIDTVASAVDAGVGDLYLFHVDPNYDDDQIDRMHGHSLELIKKAKAKVKCHVAREGMVIEL